MKIVFPDAGTMGSDIDLSPFAEYGSLTVYEESSPDEAAERIREADVLLVNKIPVNKHTIGDAHNLKLVLVTATGVNNLDQDYLKRRGIEWRNAAGYSTESVAQHTFALLFYLLEKLRFYDDYVKNGSYIKSSSFTVLEPPFFELKGKTWGIIGLGAIGRRVAAIAEAFGTKVIYASASGRPAQEGYKQVPLDVLYKESDIISVHAPLTEHTMHMINREAFSKMKNKVIFLNLSRGPVVVEQDLLQALESGQIAGAGLDVLEEEPMAEDCPLKDFNDSSRLIITPHIGWAAVEARERLMNIVLNHLKEYIMSQE